MALLRFIKAHGAGNDFILIDARQCDFPVEDSSLIARLCHRRFGIGADGLILLQRSFVADYRMIYFNADGNEQVLCGNGLRCFAAFIYELGDHRESLSIETPNGVLTCKRSGQGISSCFPEPQFLREPFPLALSCGVREVFLVNSGVPHAMLFTEDLEEEEFEELAREVRHHPAFFPEGANVSLLQWDRDKEVRIRTFERGVEGETLACGTAALAAAKVVSSLKKIDHVVVYPRSQEPLEITIANWELTGPAQLVFEGTIKLYQALSV